MIGARALLAFHRDERDPDEPDEPSEDALLGAIMCSEFQGAMVQLTRGFYEVYGK